MQGYKLPAEQGKRKWYEASRVMSGSGRGTTEDTATQDTIQRCHRHIAKSLGEHRRDSWAKQEEDGGVGLQTAGLQSQTALALSQCVHMTLELFG